MYKFHEIEEGKGYIIVSDEGRIVFSKIVAEAIIEELNASHKEEPQKRAFDVRSRESIDYGF